MTSKMVPTPVPWLLSFGKSSSTLGAICQAKYDSHVHFVRGAMVIAYFHPTNVAPTPSS